LQLPYWIDGEVKLTESRAILKYIAREKGGNYALIPEDVESVRLADVVENVTGELMFSLLIVYCWRMENVIEISY